MKFKQDTIFRYFFLAAYKLSQKTNSLTDIIMTSGEPYTGEKILSTKSGKYEPIIVDFTDRNGWNRLKEIKEEEGEKEGKKEGKKEGIIMTAINMIKAGLDMSVIKQVTGLTDKKLQKLAMQ